jgi:hypothetical protein
VLQNYLFNRFVNNTGVTFSFQCPTYGLVFVPTLPFHNATTPTVNNFPYALTLSFQAEPNTIKPLYSMTHFITPTNIFPMVQGFDYKRPFTQVDIRTTESYVDQDVLFCWIDIKHSTSAGFKDLDILEVFMTSASISPIISQERPYPMVLERRTYLEHRKSAATTEESPLYPILSQTSTTTKLPINNNSYSTTKFALDPNSFNRQAQQPALSVLVSIKLKPDQALEPSMIAQCGMVYQQQYNVPTFSKHAMPHQYQQQLTTTAINNNNNPADASIIPTPLSQFDVTSVLSLEFTPPLAKKMEFNITEVNGAMVWEINLFTYTSPLQQQTAGEISNNGLIISFPTESYYFSGSFDDCHINKVKVIATGDDGHTSGQTFSLFISASQFHFETGADLEISCSGTQLTPAWNNYQYVTAALPVRIIARNDHGAILASNTQIVNLQAMKNWLILVIMLSIISFFILLTVILTRICNGLIDRLHVHKVHVIQYSGSNNASISVSNGPVIRDAAALNSNYLTNSQPYHQLVSGGGMSSKDNGQASPQPYDFDIPLHPTKR